MLDNDPKGYYGALGLAPAADGEAISKAFRARARQVHPDINAAAGALGRFQDISEAYRVLRDPLQRLSYDLFGEELPPPVSIVPYPCTGCGGHPVEPRLASFTVVKSCLVATRRETIAGIFCPACARRVAVRASLTTLLCGWWSPLGLALTPWALMRNGLGGCRPGADNLRLLLHQARAFAARGEAGPAAALVRQAIGFAGPRERRRLAAIGRRLDAIGRRRGRGWSLANCLGPARVMPLMALLGAVGLLALGIASWPTP